MNENAKKRIKRAIEEHGLSETLKATGIPLDDALNIMGRNYIGQNIHKLMIDLKDYVLDDLPWGGVGINELEGWEENIDFLQNEDRLAIINSIALEGVDFTWYDVDMEENMGDMSMSWNDKKLLERPEVMIELFNFLCDYYRERFEGGREDDRFMMEESISERMNLQEHIRRILREETRFNKMGDERYKSCSMSDITRMEIIDDFIKKTKISPEYNVEEPDYDMLLDDWDGYDDQVYIKNELDKGRIIFYEGWVDSCWNAIKTKPEYEDMNEEEVIESIIIKRFPRIAEEFDMVIDDYGYFNNGDGYIMYVIFKSI